MVASVIGNFSQQHVSPKALTSKPAAFNQLDKCDSGLAIAVSHVKVSVSLIAGFDEDLVEGGVATCLVAIVSMSSGCNTSTTGATMSGSWNISNGLRLGAWSDSRTFRHCHEQPKKSCQATACEFACRRDRLHIQSCNNECGGGESSSPSEQGLQST